VKRAVLQVQRELKMPFYEFFPYFFFSPIFLVRFLMYTVTLLMPEILIKEAKTIVTR